MSQDWTERYRPSTLDDVIGNPKAVRELRDWANSWNSGVPSKKAVVLIGNPGVGKTSASIALANEMGWDLVEMNASDQRTGDAIRSIAIKGSNFNTFSDSGEYHDRKDNKRKLIVLDEADSLFGREDRGALPVIAELIKGTKQPVMLIVNDFYALSRKSAAVKTDTLQITFMRPQKQSIETALKKIAVREKINVDDAAFKRIAENSNGDMRAAVRNLESLAYGRTAITGTDADKLSERIVKKDMYAFMDSVFRKGDASGSRILLKDIDETPDHVLLWMDENLPYEFKDKGDLVRGYEKLSKADVFLGRVRKRQYYRFWSYAGDMMSAGIAVSKFSNVKNNERFRFPLYLTKMARSKGSRSLRKSVCMKLANLTHTTSKRISEDVLPSIKIIMENDPEFRLWVIENAELEAEELAFILNEKIDSKIVKDSMKGLIELEPPIEEPQNKEQPRSQRSLFQF